MYTIIHNTLFRQNKALELMMELLQEEFSYLKERQIEEITSLEFSIHELLRQLAREKDYIKKQLGGGKILDYAQMLPEEEKTSIIELWHLIDKLEQSCASKANLNAHLAVALLDQNNQLLDFLHKRILPPEENTYGPKGAYTTHTPQANLISGRL